MDTKQDFKLYTSVKWQHTTVPKIVHSTSHVWCNHKCVFDLHKHLHLCVCAGGGGAFNILSYYIVFYLNDCFDVVALSE